MVMFCVSEPSTSTLPVMPSSLQQLTPRRVESERNRGKEMVTVNPAANKSDQRSYASQNFAWRLLGKTPKETTPLEAAPSVLLSRLLEHACPGYAALLGKRYGAKQLLIEQEWIADLAFVAGVYRYSRIAGDVYPCGLRAWPCVSSWWTATL